jgi:hypothetical protein
VNRIDYFRQALRAQSGGIIDIHWKMETAKSIRSASIVYQVPLDVASSQIPSTRAMARRRPDTRHS